MDDHAFRCEAFQIIKPRFPDATTENGPAPLPPKERKQLAERQAVVEARLAVIGTDAAFADERRQLRTERKANEKQLTPRCSILARGKIIAGGETWEEVLAQVKALPASADTR